MIPYAKLSKGLPFFGKHSVENVQITTVDNFTSTISRRTRLQTDIISCSIFKGENVKTLMGNASVLSHHAMVHWNLAFGCIFLVLWSCRKKGIQQGFDCGVSFT